MSDFNSLAESLEAAREQGRREGRNQVLAIARRVFPTTEADHLESRVIEVTAHRSPAVGARSGSHAPSAGDQSAATAFNEGREAQQSG